MLKEIVLNAGSEPPLRVEVLSFGFKRGIPREGDLVFDVRFCPTRSIFRSWGPIRGWIRM